MHIVMDEAGDLPADLARAHNISTVPINIMFGTEQYLSTIDIDHDTFYGKTAQIDHGNFPKTSQPTPYQFADCFRKILAGGETEILAIVVSQKLSGTYASAVQAAKELAGLGKFHVFDSMAGSAVQGFMAVEASRLTRLGNGIEAVLERLEEMREKMAIVLTVDSLEYAVRGGRVSSLKSMMASLLNIKPILDVRDGLIVEAGKVRTRNKALANIVERIQRHVGDRPTKLAVLHANAAAEGQRLQKMVQSVVTVTEEFLMELSIGVAVNLGPGALGIVVIPE